MVFPVAQNWSWRVCKDRLVLLFLNKYWYALSSSIYLNSFLKSLNICWYLILQYPATLQTVFAYNLLDRIFGVFAWFWQRMLNLVQSDEFYPEWMSVQVFDVWFIFFLPRKIPQATDLQTPSPSLKTITSSSSSSIASSSSSLHSKIRTGSYFSSSLKTGSSLSSSSRGPGRPQMAIQSENSGGSGSNLVSPSKSVAVHQVASGRARNPVGRPSKHMLKMREEAAAAAALRKRKAPSQEGEHSGPDRNCIILQDRGRPPSSASSSSSSSKPTIHSALPHGQTNGTLSPSSKPRLQPSPSESHSPAAKAVWTYRRTHTTLGHSSPPDPYSAPNNSHNRVVVGDSGLHGQGSGRGFDQGVVKKRKGSGIEEHSPSSKPSVHRLPPSSSSSATSSSPRSNFYPWKDGKGGGLAGGVEKKLGTQKVRNLKTILQLV